MDRQTILAALIATLSEVQQLMGQPCPPLSANCVPINDLPKFDSKVWPVAFGLVGLKLNVEVPVEINVFRQEQTRIPNNIEQTVTAILKAIQLKATAAPIVAATNAVKEPA